jgi:hypothetical protein
MYSYIPDLADNSSSNMVSNFSLSSVLSTKLDIFKPIRRWLDNLDVQSPSTAHKICQLVPAQCPFERDVKVFGFVLFHIPPMCKINPVYDEVVAVRFRALCYLADECGEDISQYC